MHSASEPFDSHPQFIQLTSMLMSFLKGEEIDSICLPGVKHVMSVTLSPAPSTLSAATSMLDPLSSKPQYNSKSLPKVYIWVYTMKLRASETRILQVELVSMGLSLDLCCSSYSMVLSEEKENSSAASSLRS